MENDPSQRTDVIIALFDEYADSIYRYAKYSLPSDIDARDVVQEVFLRAFRNWYGFRRNSEPRTWLFRIARNYINDLLRKRRRQQAYELGQRGFLEGSHMETLIELEDALSRLQPTHRQILNLRWIQDMSVQEASEILGWSESKVRVTFHRAKNKLREILQENPESFWDESAKRGEIDHETERK